MYCVIFGTEWENTVRNSVPYFFFQNSTVPYRNSVPYSSPWAKLTKKNAQNVQKLKSNFFLKKAWIKGFINPKKKDLLWEMFFCTFFMERWRQKIGQNMSPPCRIDKICLNNSMRYNISWTIWCEERIQLIRKAGFAPNHIIVIAWWLLIWSNKIGDRYLIAWRMWIRRRSLMKSRSLQYTWAFSVTWVPWCI